MIKRPSRRYQPIVHCGVIGELSTVALVINGVSLLETELGNGQTHHALVINF
jgi:hypothetical protein